MTTTFEVWGDSHVAPAMADGFGMGAAVALRYCDSFDADIALLSNNAYPGWQVGDWLVKCLQQPVHADVIVVSSGFNEAVAIEMGFTTLKQVHDNWTLLIRAMQNHGKKVLWVPTQFRHGRAPEFPMLEQLHITPVCLGVDRLIDWDPAATEICPDRVHYTYAASMRLAELICSAVKAMA